MFLQTTNNIWRNISFAHSRTLFTQKGSNIASGLKQLNVFTTLPCNNYSTGPSEPHEADPLSRHRYSLVRPIYSFMLKSKMTADPDLARFLAKSAAVSIYSLAAVTALGTIGIDTAPILTGIGITGFTVGFALKEIATNFLSGVMLVFGKPFRKGQWLKVLGTTSQLEGEVQSIDARYVLLRTKEKALVMIPSVVVYTNPILVSNSSNITAPASPITNSSSTSNQTNLANDSTPSKK